MPFSALRSQGVPYVRDLSFIERNSHKIKIPKSVDIKDLHPYDMPEFKYIEETNHHHLYFDDNKNPQEEIELLNSINCYEDWENLGEKWLINQKGITTYDRVSKGSFNRKSFAEHSNMSKALYNVYRDNAKESGLLPAYIFPPGVATQMVRSDSTFIFYINKYPKTIVRIEKTDTLNPPNITNPDFPPGNPTIINFPPGDPTIIRIVIEKFDTVICGNDMLTSRVEIAKDTLTDGECIKRISETYYSNYKFSCDEGLFPKNQEFSNNIATNDNFSIYPNPLNNQMLVLNMPVQVIGEKVDVSLKTIQGKLIHKWSDMKAFNKMSVNAGKYLLDYSGMYIISIKSKSKVFSKKFYYLK